MHVNPAKRDIINTQQVHCILGRQALSLCWLVITILTHINLAKRKICYEYEYGRAIAADAPWGQEALFPCRLNGYLGSIHGIVPSTGGSRCNRPLWMEVTLNGYLASVHGIVPSSRLACNQLAAQPAPCAACNTAPTCAAAAAGIHAVHAAPVLRTILRACVRACACLHVYACVRAHV
eukprot:1160985-Pelagomonas_calceolata.AAC.3